jgi:hypothetical protein
MHRAARGFGSGAQVDSSAWNFTLEQFVPLWDQALVIIRFGKAAGPLRFGSKQLSVSVEPFQFLDGIVDIDERMTLAELVRQKVAHTDGLSMPQDEFAAG